MILILGGCLGRVVSLPEIRLGPVTYFLVQTFIAWTVCLLSRNVTAH